MGIRHTGIHLNHFILVWLGTEVYRFVLSSISRLMIDIYNACFKYEKNLIFKLQKPNINIVIIHNYVFRKSQPIIYYSIRLKSRSAYSSSNCKTNFCITQINCTRQIKKKNVSYYWYIKKIIL